MITTFLAPAHVFSVNLVCKEELNLMLKVIGLLVKLYLGGTPSQENGTSPLAVYSSRTVTNIPFEKYLALIATLASSSLQACTFLQSREIANPCKIPPNCRLINLQFHLVTNNSIAYNRIILENYKICTLQKLKKD